MILIKQNVGRKHAPFGSPNIHLTIWSQEPNMFTRMWSNRKAEAHLKILKVQFFGRANPIPETWHFSLFIMIFLSGICPRFQAVLLEKEHADLKSLKKKGEINNFFLEVTRNRGKSCIFSQRYHYRPSVNLPSAQWTNKLS